MHDKDCKCADCTDLRELGERATRKQRERLRRQFPKATEAELDQMQRDLPVSVSI
jgi:hypothetical protein